MKLIIDMIGWTGTGLLLTAFFLVSRGRLKGQSWSYQLLNAFGSAFLGGYSYYYEVYPSVVINVIWLGISLFALKKALRGQNILKNPSL